jgi:hypothetical protein
VRARQRQDAGDIADRSTAIATAARTIQAVVIMAAC